jgi:hypothetical protein
MLEHLWRFCPNLAEWYRNIGKSLAAEGAAEITLKDSRQLHKFFLNDLYGLDINKLNNSTHFIKVGYL